MMDLNMKVINTLKPQQKKTAKQLLGKLIKNSIRQLINRQFNFKKR